MSTTIPPAAQRDGGGALHPGAAVEGAASWSCQHANAIPSAQAAPVATPVMRMALVGAREGRLRRATSASAGPRRRPS